MVFNWNVLSRSKWWCKMNNLIIAAVRLVDSWRNAVKLAVNMWSDCFVLWFTFISTQVYIGLSTHLIWMDFKANNVCCFILMDYTHKFSCLIYTCCWCAMNNLIIAVACFIGQLSECNKIHSKYAKPPLFVVIYINVHSSLNVNIM